MSNIKQGLLIWILLYHCLSVSLMNHYAKRKVTNYLFIVLEQF